MEKKYNVIQERAAGYFAVLTLKGFQPNGSGISPLALSEELAGSLARTFTTETGRKCWIREAE